MSKIKTKSGAKKRFLTTSSGKLKHGCVGKRHKLRKRSQDMKRSTRRMSLVDDGDRFFVKKHFLPYGTK